MQSYCALTPKTLKDETIPVTMKYVIANLIITLMIGTAIIFGVASFASLPGWAYVLVTPTIFMLVAYVEEHALSGIVNQLILWLSDHNP